MISDPESSLLFYLPLWIIGIVAVVMIVWGWI